MKKDMSQSRRRGFTLVELMVVIGVIGTLASIAMPELRAAYLKAKASERTSLMNAIAKAMKDYCSEQLTTSASCALPIDGKAPANPTGTPTTDKRYFDRTQPGWKELAFEPTLPMYYQYSIEPFGSVGFIIKGEGDLDGDGKTNIRLETWELEGDTWNMELTEDPIGY